MTGYWHIVAISAGIGFLTVYFNSYSFIIGFFLWLCYLFYDLRIGKIPVIVSLVVYVFFILYIPSINDENKIIQPYNEHLLGKIVSPITVTEKIVQFHFREMHTNNKLLVSYFPDDHEITEASKTSQLKHGALCSIHGNI